MSKKKHDLSVRKAPVKTLDRDARTVDFVAATERKVRMWDWEHGEIDEVLLMQGAVLPASGQIPLLDTHSRGGVEDVLGSARDLRVEGSQLVATAHFSTVPRADETLTKIAEGHLTDCSVGYRVSDQTTVKKGEKAVIGGRSWTGPIRVVTSWIPKELSVCPIGADEAAKARSAGSGVLCVEIPEPETRAERQGDIAMTEQERQELEELRKLKAEKDAEERRKAEEEEIRKVQTGYLADTEKIRQAELTRIKEITEAAATVQDMTGADLRDIADQAIRERWDTKKAYREMTAAAKTRRPAPHVDDGMGIPVRITEDERDKIRAAATDALVYRGGLRVENKKLQGNDFVRMSLADLALFCMRSAGMPVKGLAREQLIERAMSTSDLPYILAATANKYLFTGWEEAPTTYQIWCGEGALQDYKDATFPRPSAFPDLQEANPNSGEYTYAAFGEAKETTALKHWGRLFGVTLKALVNDDLGVFTTTPQRMGEAARRTIDKYVYVDVLQGSAGAGQTMGDGNALFDATNHLNYVGSGSGGAVSVTTVDALAQLMENQKDSDGTSYIGNPPQFLLANSYYRFLTQNLLVSTTPTQLGDATTPVYNPWANLTPVFSPHITINSKKWWALAGPRGKTVTVYGLGGPPAPSVDDRPEFTSASWTYRVRMDFVAKAVDWKYLAANYGT